MRRLSILFLSLLLLAAPSYSCPAYNGKRRVAQPDGSYVTIRLVGDEYRSFNTTDDGYSLVRNSEGYYVYAKKDIDGQLAPTNLIAHDASERTAADIDYLRSVGKMLTPVMNSQMAQMRQQNNAARAKQMGMSKAKRYDYDNFKGLVILVEYNDRSFKYDDYADIMEKMINQDDYKGETRTNNGGTCTGSMRDYFRDNSNEVFTPTFDIVGPVKVNRSQYYPRPNGSKGSDNFSQLMIDACTAADSIVNFKDYDVDHDGKVDMIYFIYAGLPSYIDGNDERLLWPHQSDISYYRNVRKDGVFLSRYACSTELFGTGGWQILEGIGTMCHEFSHVLGLPDLYDTGNLFPDDDCVTPGTWSVMAGGTNLNNGRTPCGFSLFERYALGFATPKLLNKAGHYSLAAISSENSGYRIDTPQKKEYFLLENRQKVKWDSQLPGHGMLIFRVDSTNTSVWEWYNAVNDNPDHPYYELVRAKGGTSSSSRDPFPGTGRVTAIDNQTSPANLLSWTGKKSSIGLKNITEKTGTISFDAFDVNVLSSVTLPDSLILGMNTHLQLTPVIDPDYVPVTFTWRSSDEAVATVDSVGVVTAIALGEADITVTANDVLSATCHITVGELPMIGNIAAFRAMEEGTEKVLKLDNAKVLMAYGNDIYVRDSTAAIVFSGTGLNVSNNDVLNGSIYGKLVFTNNMPQLIPVEGFTNINNVHVANNDIEAEEHEKVMGQLTDDDLADKIVVRAAQLSKIDGRWYATDGNQKAWIFNTFKLKGLTSFKTYENKYFDIHAILTTDVVSGEVTYVLSFTDSMVEVEKKDLTQITLPDSVSIDYGTSLQLTPTLVPEDAPTTLTWASDNEEVATVDDQGLVTGISAGTATITVTANGVLTAQCKVTVLLTMAGNIETFRTLDDGNKAMLTLNDAKVLFVNGTDIYLRDNTGSIVLSGTGIEAKCNDILSGAIFGQIEHNNRMPLLKAVEGITTDTTVTVTESAEEAEPRETNSVDELTDEMLADLIVVRATPLVKEDGMIFATGDSLRARVFNTFGLSGISMPKSLEDKHFDVYAILTTDIINDSINYVLSFTKAIEEVNGTVGDVNGDGVVDVADISSIISVMAGELNEDDPAVARADVNADGSVDVADISTVITIMASNARRNQTRN